jgi:hypothetical protein
MRQENGGLDLGVVGQPAGEAKCQFAILGEGSARFLAALYEFRYFVGNSRGLNIREENRERNQTSLLATVALYDERFAFVGNAIQQLAWSVA